MSEIKEEKDRWTIRKFFSGHKTKIGALSCITAGGLKIAGLWYPLLDRTADGLYYAGMGLIAYGIWARLVKIFYPVPSKGRPKYGKPKLKAPKIG